MYFQQYPKCGVTVSHRALEGIRVAAFTHFAAGPIAAQYLGALGADVIKVESPRRDLNRYAVRDPDDALGEISPYFVCTNRNQRTIALDLKSKGGIEAAKKLIASSDIVLENYRPGVMDKLGIGYEGSKALNENIIYCSFSAYDSEGSARDKPGQDLLMQAASGLASLSGRSSDLPVPVGVYVIDGFTAMQGVIGILAALNHRKAGGMGQWIRTDMMSTALYMMTQEASFVMNTSAMTTRSRAGIAHANHGAPYGVYPTKDEGVPIAVSVFGDPDIIRGLAVALGVDDQLSDYFTVRGLKTHRDDIAEIFAAAISELSYDDAARLLTDAGAWVTPVRTLAEALDDPAVAASGVIRNYNSAFVGAHRVVTEPLQMSETPLARDRPAPDFGEHTDEVLADLGYAKGDRESLYASRAALRTIDRTE